MTENNNTQNINKNFTGRINTNGQIMIPAEIRETTNMEPGDYIDMTIISLHKNKRGSGGKEEMV